MKEGKKFLDRWGQVWVLRWNSKRGYFVWNKEMGIGLWDNGKGFMPLKP